MGYDAFMCGCSRLQYNHGAHRSNAEELVAQYPVVEVEGTVALCDGGEGGRRDMDRYSHSPLPARKP